MKKLLAVLAMTLFVAGCVCSSGKTSNCCKQKSSCCAQKASCCQKADCCTDGATCCTDGAECCKQACCK